VPVMRERFQALGWAFTSKLVIESSPGKGHRYYRSALGIDANISENAVKFADFSLRVSGEQCVSPGSVHPVTLPIRAAIRKLYPHKEPDFDLALHLGCRRSNLYGQHNAKRAPMEPLQWSEVNLDVRGVTFQRSKSGKSYRVPINDTALAAFKKLHERGDGTGAVIRKPRPARTGSEGRELFSSRKWFEKCLAEAEIKDLTWHDFRHTFGTRLRAARVQIEDIRYLLGHGAKSITERYAHANLDVLREAVATLDRKTENQTGTKTGTPPVLRIRAS
jgi:hypothetical protein